jgi:hypothetical protein
MRSHDQTVITVAVAADWVASAAVGRSVSGSGLGLGLVYPARSDLALRLPVSIRAPAKGAT